MSLRALAQNALLGSVGTLLWPLVNTLISHGGQEMRIAFKLGRLVKRFEHNWLIVRASLRRPAGLR